MQKLLVGSLIIVQALSCSCALANASLPIAGHWTSAMGFDAGG